MKNNTTDTKKPSRQEKVQALSEDLEKSIHEFMNGENIWHSFPACQNSIHTPLITSSSSRARDPGQPAVPLTLHGTGLTGR